MPQDDPFQEKQHSRPSGYILIEHGICSTGFLAVFDSETPYPTILAAKTAGEERASAVGLVSDGWRQEAPRVWVLLPHRRYCVEMVV